LDSISQSTDLEVTRRSKDHDESSNSSSSALYSLSDLSISSSSASDRDSTPSLYTFLPPSRPVSRDQCELLRSSFLSDNNAVSSEYLLDFHESNEQLPDEGFCGEPGSDPNYDHELTSPPSQMSSVDASCASVFDVESMKEKLAAQKEYLLGSFQRQTTLPYSFPTSAKHAKVEKVIDNESLTLLISIKSVVGPS
jgi:hypothetical protein